MVTKNSNSVYVIAEAGVNHNGCIDNAKRLIDVAAEAGADAVKFQTFKAAKLVTVDAATAEYQTQTTGESSQYSMLKKLELADADHQLLWDYAEERNIQFLSTGFDNESLQMLDKLGVPFFKVPSGEITNYPLLQTLAKLGKPTVVSTGMANLNEISECLEVLVSGKLTHQNLTVLHCNTQYPTPMRDVNLRAMLTIQDNFPDVAIGYSDHTLGIEIPVAAVALGATLIEKHFTLDKSMPGPDHAASLEPNELTAMISAIRNIEAAIGDGIKQASPSEQPNIEVARKSIVASTAISAGDIFSAANLTAKRPGSGRSPMDWPKLIGQSAKRDYVTDELID